MSPLFQEIGMPAEYVNKLARMFQDMQVSEDLNTEFKELTKNNSESLPSAGKECHCLESFEPLNSSSILRNPAVVINVTNLPLLPSNTACSYNSPPPTPLQWRGIASHLPVSPMRLSQWSSVWLLVRAISPYKIRRQLLLSARQIQLIFISQHELLCQGS